MGGFGGDRYIKKHLKKHVKMKLHDHSQSKDSPYALAISLVLLKVATMMMHMTMRNQFITGM